MTRAMLVAAGFGTRLAPLTDELPKPAVPVANRPLAWFALDHLHRFGVRDFVMNTHHLGRRLESSIEPWTPSDTSLRFSREEAILGTGGGLRRAWDPRDDETLLVMNAKLVFDPDIAELLAVHASAGAIATMVLRALPTGSAFGGVDVDDAGCVRAILSEQPPTAGLTRRMFTGVHVLHARAWRDLPEDGCVIRHSYRAWLARGEPVMSILAAEPWADLGITPQHYAEGNLALLDGERTWPGIAPTAGGVLVADDARVGAGCKLHRCAVGAGATIDPGVELDSAIVWPGAHVTSHLKRTIMTTAGVRVQF